jgi:hypothetical protein
MSPKMAEYEPDLEPDPHQLPDSVDDWKETFVTDTEGSGETKIDPDPVTGATFEILLEETSKMCAVAAAWEIQNTKESTPLLQARDDLLSRAGVLKSELDYLGGGHGQEDVPRLHRCFGSLLEQFNWLNQHVREGIPVWPKSFDDTRRILKRKASDTPSPEIKVQSSSSSASSHVLKRARSSLFSDEAGATAAAAVTAMTKSSCGFGNGALVAVCGIGRQTNVQRRKKAR